MGGRGCGLGIQGTGRQLGDRPGSSQAVGRVSAPLASGYQASCAVSRVLLTSPFL